MRILLVEDDRRISDFVVKGLEENGFSVTLAPSAEIAKDHITAAEWDIILMDIMLPGMDGVQLTRMIRHRRNNTPVLVISALGEADDRVHALDSGADDYLTKPFHFKELISRINALTRRSKMHHMPDDGWTLHCGDLIVNLEAHTVTRDGNPVSLSAREFRLLVFLLENKNKVLSRSRILNAVWGINYNTHTNIVDVYISYLRSKIDKGWPQKLIHTIKGAGYCIREVE